MEYMLPDIAIEAEVIVKDIYALTGKRQGDERKRDHPAPPR
jgi:hypothetical protein